MTRVGIELGKRKAFAWALDWPGWCRWAKDEASVIATMERYATRYEAVAQLASQQFDPTEGLEVVERVAGNSTTDWGVPAIVTPIDRLPIERVEAEQLAGLLDAVWRRFDAVALSAPAELRNGPRGGGRDTARIVAHVVGADHMYTRRIGLTVAEPAARDIAAIDGMRGQVLALLRQRSDGTPFKRSWTARHALRYIAFHAMEHAWEIEDRSAPA